MIALARAALVFLSLFLIQQEHSLAAEPLPIQSGRTVLTVTGHLGVTNQPQAAGLSMAFLQSFPPLTIRTTTPWTTGTVTFVGVRLRDLLMRLDARPVTAVEAKAIDDYTAPIPLADINAYDIILAYRLDGKPLDQLSRGPLWVIYPFSDHDELQQETYYSRGVWQLDRLIVN